jgi:hypothetical protein
MIFGVLVTAYHWIITYSMTYHWLIVAGTALVALWVLFTLYAVPWLASL